MAPERHTARESRSLRLMVEVSSRDIYHSRLSSTPQGCNSVQSKDTLDSEVPRVHNHIQTQRFGLCGMVQVSMYLCTSGWYPKSGHRLSATTMPLQLLHASL